MTPRGGRHLTPVLSTIAMYDADPLRPIATGARAQVQATHAAGV